MLSMTIQNPEDITVARNQLRKYILAERWSPTICAHATVVLAVVGELILTSDTTGTIEAGIVQRQGKQGIELRGKIAVKDLGTDALDLIHHQLRRVVDSLEIDDHDNRLQINIFLLGDKDTR